jgi:hypothetical protein
VYTSASNNEAPLSDLATLPALQLGSSASVRPLRNFWHPILPILPCFLLSRHYLMCLSAFPSPIHMNGIFYVCGYMRRWIFAVPIPEITVRVWIVIGLSSLRSAIGSVEWGDVQNIWLCDDEMGHDSEFRHDHRISLNV